MNRNDVSNFEIIVEFDKNKSNPEFLFESIADLIAAFTKIDDSVVSVLDENIKFTYQLNLVENGSIRITLARILKQFDDKDVESLDYKNMIGKFINKGRHKAIEMLENSVITPELLNDFDKELMDSAKPLLSNGKIPKPISRVELLSGIERAITAASKLDKDSSISYIDENNKPVKILPKADIDETVYELSLSPNIKKTENMILRVKKVDLLGNSKWEFLYDNIHIKANMQDARWLNDFHNKIITVGPGDSLRVVWEYEYTTEKGISRAYNYTITKVLKVITGQFEEQQGLF